MNVFGTYGAPQPLAEELRLVDLGAHVGFFGRWALNSWPVRTLISVEADAGNFEVLQLNCQAFADQRWRNH